MNSNSITRRDSLKALSAAGGALAVSAFLPVHWLKPVVTGGVLPVHARASGGEANHGTRTFTYTGTEQTFDVPGKVTSVEVQAYGAKGGDSDGGGGRGGLVSALITVTPLETIYIFVGGQGAGGYEANSGAGGFNGGGAGRNGGGGGGGASDVRRGGNGFSNRVAVAGGGGGGGGDYSHSYYGGAGGDLAGQDGGGDYSGQGGSAAAGGKGGTV